MVYLIGRKRADAMLALARQDDQAKIVLIHEGVYAATPGLRDVYALKADVEAAGVRPQAQLIDEGELIRMILQNKVVSHA